MDEKSPSRDWTTERNPLVRNVEVWLLVGTFVINFGRMIVSMMVLGGVQAAL